MVRIVVKTFSQISYNDNQEIPHFLSFSANQISSKNIPSIPLGLHEYCCTAINPTYKAK